MWSSSLRAKNSGSVPYIERELDTSCILFLAVIFHCVLLDICYGCLLSLSTWALLVSLDMSSVCLIHLCLLGSFLVGMFSMHRTIGALQRLGRAVMPCRHRAAWLFVSCLFKSSLAAVFRLSALWDLHWAQPVFTVYAPCRDCWRRLQGWFCFRVDALLKEGVFFSCILMLWCYLAFHMTPQSTYPLSHSLHCCFYE